MSDEGLDLYPQTSFTPKQKGVRVEYNQRWADIICEMLINGESLRAICSADDMPAISTVMKWLHQNPDFAEQYARAREAQQDTYADEITFIADTEPDPQRARVRIDARKWHASKLSPKKYGDKVDLTHGNPDGSPITFQTIFETKPDK